MNKTWMKRIAVVALWACFVVLWAARAGQLDPPAAPAPTMKTLEQVGTWSVQIPTAAQRFVVLAEFNNEAVLDKETGLVWEQAAGASYTTQQAAQEACWLSARGGRGGWRLPTMAEFGSIAPLPAGNPFSYVVSWYWTSSEATTDPGSAYAHATLSNQLRVAAKNGPNAMQWCVRGPVNH